MIKYCPSCRSRKHPTLCPGYMNFLPDSINVCPSCNVELQEFSMEGDELRTLVTIKAPIELIDAMVELRDKDFLEFQTKMSQFRMEAAQVKATQAQVSNKPKCPKCTSTNIQIVPRKWSLFAGFATNKTDRVCVNCKYKW